MLIYYAVSRWSSGNRRRATSAREVIEVAGSNHVIGVILNLAWGPNNFSPSMIWSLRTRSNSQTGLGAEELLPAELAFCFCCFFLLYPLLSSFLSSFSLFFVPWAVFGPLCWLLVIFWILCCFLLLRSGRQRPFFLEIEMVFFALTVLCIFLPLFFLWRFLWIILISSSSSFDRLFPYFCFRIDNNDNKKNKNGKVLKNAFFCERILL